MIRLNSLILFLGQLTESVLLILNLTYIYFMLTSNKIMILLEIPMLNSYNESRCRKMIVYDLPQKSLTKEHYFDRANIRNSIATNGRC